MMGPEEQTLGPVYRQIVHLTFPSAETVFSRELGYRRTAANRPSK